MKKAKSLYSFIKKLLVFSRLDNMAAYLNSKYPNLGFFRFIPTWDYYKTNDTKTVTRNGVKYTLHPADYSEWSIFADQLDPHMIVAKKYLINHNPGLILDIGANCGVFGLSVAHLLKRNGIKKKIYCYEPNPSVFNILQNNVSLNPMLTPFIELKNYGLGEKVGVLEMQIPKYNSGAGSIVRNYEKVPHDKHLINISTVDIEVLNSEDSVEFIKLDVENFEYFVLAGSIEVIKKFRPIIFLEVGPGQINQSELFNLLKGCGYAFFKILDKRLTEVDPLTTTFTSIDNITAVHCS